jgi:hypothetical protein
MAAQLNVQSTEEEERPLYLQLETHETVENGSGSDDWDLDWERYDSKRSETMEVKTRADGVERNAHTDLAIKFRGRILHISLLLTEVPPPLRAVPSCKIHPRGAATIGL